MPPSHAVRPIALTVLLASGLLAAAVRSQSHPAGDPADSRSAPYTAGLIGSKHDFTDRGRLPRDLCLPCHTPHLSPIPAQPTSRPAPAPPVLLGDVALSESSLICLSCHDGVAAPGVLVGAHALTWSETDTAGPGPGRASLVSHPVGVRYPSGNPKYHSRSAVESSGRIHLPGGRIQCVSCHDPHNSERHRAMLVESNERSRLCLACHRI